jgi:zinc and cadmium transporter
MTTFIWILIVTFSISLIAFVGALTLFLKEKILNKILLLLVAFSAGTLIGGAFLHLIPEAINRVGIKENSILEIFLYLIFGFCIFFVLEQFIRWHHHHTTRHPEIMPFSYLILISDGLHNFIDGLIIAGSFLVGIPVGLVTALAVALHEIPQEIGDYGILVYGGFKKIRALFLNFASATAIILGGIAGFFLSERIGEKIVFLLPFAAGTFIYVAASDLIPHIKKERDLKKSAIHFLVFLTGIGLMLLIKLLL